MLQPVAFSKSRAPTRWVARWPGHASEAPAKRTPRNNKSTGKRAINGKFTKKQPKKDPKFTLTYYNIVIYMIIKKTDKTYQALLETRRSRTWWDPLKLSNHSTARQIWIEETSTAKTAGERFFSSSDSLKSTPQRIAMAAVDRKKKQQ